MRVQLNAIGFEWKAMSTDVFQNIVIAKYGYCLFISRCVPHVLSYYPNTSDMASLYILHSIVGTKNLLYDLKIGLRTENDPT